MPSFLALALGLGCSSTEPQNRAPAPADAPASTAPDADPAAAPVAAAPAQPDVVVVVIDTLRVDRLGLYGATPSPSPWLDARAEDAAVFDRAWATSSWTAPSTASIVTGRYPPSTGVVRGLIATRELEAEISEGDTAKTTVNRIRADHRTLGEHFDAAGYTTIGLASNINIGEDLGFARGFDHFHYAPQATARTLAIQATGWWQQAQGPRLLYLHLNDVHSPYQQREPWYQAQADQQADILAAYDSGISYVDQYLGQMEQFMGWDDDTVVVIATDHGEEFGDHGQHGHLFSLYRELTHALFIVRAPGVRPGRYDDTVSGVDLLPTTLALAGLPLPGDLDGTNLAPRLLGGAEVDADRTVFAHRVHTGKTLWAAMRGGLYFIEGPLGHALYTWEDVAQQDDVAEVRSADADALSGALDQARAGWGEITPEVTEMELNGSTLETLRTLGYVE